MQFAPLYPWIYKILKPTFPNCLWSGASDKPVVALTFDDGPHAEYTLPLLEVLDYYQVRASFFWLGSCVDRHPEIAKEVVARGHWVGLHGYYHRSFPTLSKTELKQSLQQTQLAIASACDLKPQQIIDVRPPNGIFTPQTLQLLRQWHYHPIMWSVVPEDWVRPGIEVVVRRILEQVTNGSLIVLHDGSCGGRDVAETVERLIPQLRSRGLSFATINQIKGEYKI